MKTMLRRNMRGFLIGSFFMLSPVTWPASANAQNAVTVDLGAIDANVPQLSVPGERATPVTLRPPAGIKPGATDSAIKLRPPPSTGKRTLPAPTAERTAAQRPKPVVTRPPAAPKALTPTPPARSAQPTPTAPKAMQEEAEAVAPAEAEPAALVEPAKTHSQPEEFTIPYGTENVGIPERADDSLRILAARMVKNTNLRVEVIAYASDSDESVSRSRRLSLERAINVRNMLLDSGVDSSHVNVRALGEKSDGGDPDRVVMIVTAR
jgi:outer membrane protein OmpA-like peptidoglycan-associated protein